jgi:hypothetical protein
MAGPIEGGVAVATGFIDSLKNQPLSLALVVMNLCLLLFFYVILTRVADQRKDEIGLLYADKKEVRELLAKCVVPAMPQQRTELRIEGAPLAPVVVQPGFPKVCTAEQPCQ